MQKKIINIEQIISGQAMQIQGYGPVMMINSSGEELSAIYHLLKKKEKNFHVYRKSDLPEYFHFSHNPLIPPLILIADPGWSLVDNKISANLDTYLTDGNHGYDNHFMDMHGIFYAMGPAFKKGFRTGTLRNIDIYPLICKILKIEPNQEIDGNLERIEFILQK